MLQMTWTRRVQSWVISRRAYEQMSMRFYSLIGFLQFLCCAMKFSKNSLLKSEFDVLFDAEPFECQFCEGQWFTWKSGLQA